MAAFIWLLVAQELWMLSLFAVIFGFAYGGFIVLVSPIVAEQFGLRAHGTILGVTSFAMMIGGGTGPLMTGRIFDISGSYQIAFLICAATGVIGLTLTTVLTSIKN